MHLTHLRLPISKTLNNRNSCFLVCFAYMALGMSSYENFFRKFFFQTVHFILKIFIYYDIFISLILLKLSYIENTSQTLILSPKSLENITFRISGKDSSLDWGIPDTVFKSSVIIFLVGQHMEIFLLVHFRDAPFSALATKPLIKVKPSHLLKTNWPSPFQMALKTSIRVPTETPLTILKR